MRAERIGIASVLCLLTAGVGRAGNAPEIVTNPTPAVSATMTLSDANGCPNWTVRGKVKPAYRGHGANVSLVCLPDTCATGSVCTGVLVFPPSQGCDFDVCPLPANVDACGNFTFDIPLACGAPVQLDNSYVCMFVVHVDDSKSPQSCGNNNTAGVAPVQDPNGSCPCSGAYCPTSP
jgi:hypothetical protein